VDISMTLKELHERLALVDEAIEALENIARRTPTIPLLDLVALSRTGTMQQMRFGRTQAPHSSRIPANCAPCK